jgi:DNA-binding NtrC family response regulator
MHGNVRPLEEIERDYILAALALNGGNQTHTAAQLQIGSATLFRKLKSYGLTGRKRGGAPRTPAVRRARRGMLAR